MKKILITGATSGMGKNLAYYLKNEKEGYDPIILARNEEKLKEISNDLQCDYIDYDLENLGDISIIFSKLEEKNIILDGIVHCAGISPLMKVEENNVDTMIKTFSVNLFSFIELCKYYSMYGNDGGSIVAISSVASRVGSYRQTVYGASKAALEEAVRCIAKEFLGRRVRVNCVLPGAVETEMFKKLESESAGLREKLEKYYPLGVADPAYISYVVEYLLSDKSKYTTGRYIDVDSGFFAAK